MLADRRVKIVATIGPATNSKDNLKKAIMAGLNVARLNFSHGTHEDHYSVIKNIRELITELDAPVALLQDLQGPKIRVGKFKNDSIEIKQDDEVILSPEFKEGDEGKIPVDFKGLIEACNVGDKILLDDGLLELKVTKKHGQKLHCTVVHGGVLKNRKGINIPGVMLPVDCLTKKDIEDLNFGLEHNVDYVALSFVRQASDIKKLKDIIAQKNPSTKVIAKIEMSEAIDNLEEIINLSDAVMVARGDLAVEIGQTRLPSVQKRIIHLCNLHNKPVITATQMLDSMVENPRPTRAEITDVANAVIDGSDALMLSAESASGKYPFDCIRTMGQIILETEKEEESIYNKLDTKKALKEIPQALGASACLTADKLDASAIVCLTTTGKTARIISGFRPKAKLIAITHLMHTLNRLELVWGIQTYSIKPYKSTDEAMSQIQQLLLSYGLVKNGDKVVLTLGVPVIEKAKTNSIRVYSINKSDVSLLSSDELPLRCKV